VSGQSQGGVSVRNSPGTRDKIVCMEDFPGIRLQDRDFQILRAIAESPACSRVNLADMFFNGSYEAAKKRTAQLARAGLVQNEDVDGLGKTILRLTQKGVEILTATAKGPSFVRTDPVSRRMRRHERMLADCQFAFGKAAQETNCISDFWMNPMNAAFSVRCADHAVTETVRPDAFCSFQLNEARTFFFFEIDRSTETQGHLIHLAKQYKAFWQSGEFPARFGNSYEPKRTTFRVLLILNSRRRLENTLNNLRLHARVETLFWLTTFEDFARDPFGLIWICPADLSHSPHQRPKRTLF
jgi:hypothetical protein